MCVGHAVPAIHRINLIRHRVVVCWIERDGKSVNHRRTFIKICIAGVLAGAGTYAGLRRYRRDHVLKIVEHPDPLLRKVSDAIQRIDDRIVTLSQAMTDTLRFEAMLEFFSRASLYKGLAAPQVGHCLRMIVCGIYGQVKVLINPEIIEKKGTFASEEFCLSLPGYETRMVERSNRLKVAYRQLDDTEATLTASGGAAALLAHEIDHLNGVLYIDYQK
jgi:peptide deformylase